MAIRLPDRVEISSAASPNEPCEFCHQPGCADPDDLDSWAQHLVSVHGYQIETDSGVPNAWDRTIALTLVGWSPRAKFRPNTRVTVNDHAPGDYQERRGTVVGWLPDSSEYCVRFDEDPIVGWLASDSLEQFVRTTWIAR